ncbi:Concanavalin A-like lectin/glucanase, subgroup [Cynara cardunculus var. scolymus]|uniref:Concanavalin A-like lectin/glucanase, subgroup n=1 Tax=Cynara cardunculus var. scolymus TaxID=59895 RepID=A0A124SDR6_CYNCS|nr:Concanavalin A-like lectin/glucanase, subgroup [Cynara cardunculus var. scolymus]
MPPPQPPPELPSLLLILSFIFHLVTVSAHTCARAPPCPPFTTTAPPFPFSNSPGCGHPSFQIQCPSPPLPATISINNHHFFLLHYDPTSTSLSLHPTTTSTTTTTNCTTTHSLSTIPTQPINFSNSPFQPTDSFCSRLSYLRPCLPPTLPNCSHCPWECKITKNPLQIIHSCGSIHPPQLSKEGCQYDILGFLDSFLKFGIEVEWEEKDSYFSNCTACKSINGVCGFNSSDPNKPFLCFQPSIQPQKSSPEVRKPKLRVAMMSLAVLFLCFLLFILISTYISRRKRKNSPLEDPAVIYLHRHRSASLLPPVFTFDELQSSTNNFDPNRKIGDGGFGSVYVAHLEGNRTYAVKYLHKQNPTSNSFSTKSFCNEILILSSLNHPNLVKLHGYCSDPRGLLLVYEYVPNGTLSDHLHVYKKQCLTWQTRIDIALQIALAIEYLHFSVVPPIVHRDITIQMGLLGEVIDPRLAAVDGGGVAAVAELSFRCVAADKDDRPDAREVVAELRRIKGRTRGGGTAVRAANSSNVVVPDGGPMMVD